MVAGTGGVSVGMRKRRQFLPPSPSRLNKTKKRRREKKEKDGEIKEVAFLSFFS